MSHDIAQCEGCGKRPEVYGSSWCSHCHDTLPQYVQDRLLMFRNACTDAYWARTRIDVERILGAVIARAYVTTERSQ